MTSGKMEVATFWLPIVGGILLGGIAGNAWFGGNKILGLWFGFAGLVCFQVLIVLQIQNYISPSKNDTANRPWVGIDTQIVGPLIFGKSGAGIQLKITMKNDGRSPATNVLPYPMIFVREKQPFSVEEIIKRRTKTFNPGGGLGYSIFPDKSIIELNTPSMEAKEFEGVHGIAPFLLVGVKYRSTLDTKIHLTANLYSLARRNPTGGALVVFAETGNVQPSELMLIPLGSYAD